LTWAANVEAAERRRCAMAKVDKVRKVMHEYKVGTLHSGSKSGPKVTSRKQAMAIAMSEAGKSKQRRRVP